MSRPKHKWYGELKRRIGEGSWKDPKTFQDYILMKAIFEAQAETLKLPNGDERLKVVEMVVINRKSYTQAELELFYSRRNIERWATSFVNMVGRKAGY